MKLIKNTLDDLNNYLEIFSSNNKYYPLVENKNMTFKDSKKEIIPRKINQNITLIYKLGNKMRIPGVLDDTGAKYPFKKTKSKLAKSGIKIKKKNRGKFTQYCNGNVTQECINKAKRSGNKTLIKRAVFAENARKWKK